MSVSVAAVGCCWLVERENQLVVRAVEQKLSQDFVVTADFVAVVAAVVQEPVHECS